MRSSVLTYAIFASSLLITGISCEKEDDSYDVGTEHGVPIDDVIKFQAVGPMEPEADSVSPCTITVKIDSRASAANRVVKFFTSLGTFTNGDTVQTITANSDGVVRANLISDSPGNAKIRVSVMDRYARDTMVNFRPAMPDDMLVSPDKYEADTAASFQLTSRLFRDPQRGKPSDPIKVLFTVVPLDTTINLMYPAFTFSDGQSATIALTNPFKVTGRFNITAKAGAATGDSISRTVMIRIN
ncbi:hypothetical protein LZZ85_20905 [Terrimonas sp. NA20]|uniref:Uncharacterized protein n=1 Tax=Terrimonas ginsenosidimutans TaxID=2908004 RepID=A0ABS9KX05_9BACT|nr:hypothetical protein [Terrimonas ginsenosidimutans]MCG2616772.1 hypothetical protein [Terrimonas ginsenosidimutans]